MGANSTPSPSAFPAPKKSFTDLLILVIFHIYNFFIKIVKPILSICALPTVKRMVAKRLKPIGIGIDGGGPGDFKILNEEAYLKVFLEGDLGAIESIMRGYVEYDGVQTFEKIFSSRKFHTVAHPLYGILSKAQIHFPMKAWSSGEQPGADLFKTMLDENMQYSCGCWETASNLKEAQEAKLELIAKKLKLKPGMRVLDVNSEFGGLAKYLAKNYEVEVVGYTSSKQQKVFADKICKGLPVEIRIGGCHSLDETEEFDRVVSIGSLGTLLVKSYDDMFSRLKSVLKDDGLLLIQEIGMTHKSSPSLLWCQKYAYVPRLKDIISAIDDHFIVENMETFNDSYKTFEAWEKNLEKAWSKLVFRYGDEFRRAWLLYLHAFQAILKTRTGQVFQMVLTKN